MGEPTARRLPMKRVMAAVALVGGAILGFSNSALASSIVVISGPSPYSNCSNAGQSGTNFVNAEVEPSASVNPADSSSIITTFQQDRWSNGGAHGLVAGFSSDGGKTWGETTQQLSICAPNAVLDPFTGAPYNRASDPWVSFGPDGTAYS